MTTLFRSILLLVGLTVLLDTYSDNVRASNAPLSNDVEIEILKAKKLARIQRAANQHAGRSPAIQ